MGDPSAKRMLAEASEIHALQSSSHMVTGCYDHAIRVWQACDAERVKPLTTVANAGIPHVAELKEPLDATGIGGSLLVLMDPRIPVAANSNVTFVLPGFEMLPVLECEKEAMGKKRAPGEDDVGAAAHEAKAASEAASKQAYTSLNKLNWRYDADHPEGWCEREEAGVDKAVSLKVTAIAGAVLLTVTPQADVGCNDAWVLLLPHSLELVLPWDSDEDAALSRLVREQLRASDGGEEGGERQGQVDWDKVAAGLPNRQALEAEHRWLKLKVTAAHGEYQKPSECPVFLPFPTPAAAAQELVWEAQVCLCVCLCVFSRAYLHLGFTL